MYTESNIEKLFKGLNRAVKKYDMPEEHDMYLTLKEVADYLGEDPEDVDTEAIAENSIIVGSDVEYNIFEVIYFKNSLDNAAKRALEFKVLTWAREQYNMEHKTNHKSCLERKVTPYRNGRFVISYYDEAGKVKQASGATADEARAKAREEEMKAEQKKLLAIIKQVAPEKLGMLSASLTASFNKDSEKSQKAGTREKKSKAKAVEAKVVEEIVVPEEKSKAPTYEEAFNEWIIELLTYPYIQNTSVDKCETVYNLHIREQFKDFIKKPIDEITTYDVHVVLQKLRNNSSDSDFTIRQQVVTAPIIKFCLLYKLKVNFEDAKKSLRKPKEKYNPEKKEQTAIDGKLQKKIEETIDILAKKNRKHIPGLMLIKLNSYLGLREAELAALTANDIDLNEKVVHINKAEIQYRERDKNGKCTGRMVYEISNPKTKNGVRDIPLIDEACVIAKELLDYHKSHSPKIDELMCYGNEAITKKRAGKLGYLYIRIAKVTGVTTKEFHSHLQRKTFATYLVNHGVDVVDIQRYMGHANIDTTLKYYVIPIRRSIEEKRAILQAAFEKKN